MVKKEHVATEEEHKTYFNETCFGQLQSTKKLSKEKQIETKGRIFVFSGKDIL